MKPDSLLSMILWAVGASSFIRAQSILSLEMSKPKWLLYFAWWSVVLFIIKPYECGLIAQDTVMIVLKEITA